MGLAKKILESTFLLSGSNIFVRVISFLSTILIIRNLTLANYGTVILAVAAIGPISTIASLGLSKIIISDIARYRDEKKYSHIKSLLKSYTKVVLLIAVFLIILAWIFCSFLEKHYGIALHQYLFVLTPLALVGVGQGLFQTVFTAHEDFRSLSFLPALEAFIKLACVIIVLLFTDLNIFLVLGIYLASQISALFGGFPRLISDLKYLKNVSSKEKLILWSLFRGYGKWGSIRALVNDLTSNINPWILNIVLGVESVAIFHVAQKLYAFLPSLFPITKVIFPIISRKIKDFKLTQKLVWKATKGLLWINIPLVAAAFFLGPLLIKLVFPQYISSILIFQILLLLLLLNPFILGQGPIYFGLRQQKLLSYIFFVGIFLHYALIISFSLIWGLIGYAFATILAALVPMILREHFLRTRFNLATWNWKEFFRYDQYDRTLFSKIFSKTKKTILP